MDNKKAIKELSEWLDGCCGGEEIEPTRQALRLAISALQAQEAKTQLSAEGTTSDLISRQEAIDAIVNKVSRIGLHDNSEVARYGATFRQHEIIDIIESLPSAQPEIEERKEESAQNVPKEDLIPRKEAIEAECEVCQIAPKKERGHNCTYYVHGCKEIECLRALPSAQPEPQWIPVSERLPEKYGNYLILIHGEDEPDIGTINPNDKRGWSLCDANGFYWASDKELIVTAWMPLPEPYRAERRTDD